MKFVREKLLIILTYSLSFQSLAQYPTPESVLEAANSLDIEKMTNLIEAMISGCVCFDFFTEEVRERYIEAAESGDLKAQVNLGIILAWGLGGEYDDDYKKILSLLRPAADENNGLALYFLGSMYVSRIMRAKRDVKNYGQNSNFPRRNSTK